MKWHINLMIMLFLFEPDQSLAQVPIDIGLKGGFSYPDLRSVNGSARSGYTGQPGGDGAVFTELFLSKHISAIVQVEYISLGAQHNGFQPLAMTSDMKQLVPSSPLPDYLYADYKKTIVIKSGMLPVFCRNRI